GFRRLRVRQAKARPKERPLTVIEGTDKTCPVGVTWSVGRRLLRPVAKCQRSGIYENKDKRCLFHHVPPSEFEGPILLERHLISPMSPRRSTVTVTDGPSDTSASVVAGSAGGA